LAASRQTAKASGSRASSVSPPATRWRNSSVLPVQRVVGQRRHARFERIDLDAVLRYPFSSRSLRLPKILVRKPWIIKTPRTGQSRPA
jgi:hypothetical protein